jgi:hypothetical protein
MCRVRHGETLVIIEAACSAGHFATLTVWQGSYGTASEGRKRIFKIFRGRRQAARRLIIQPAHAKVATSGTTLESSAVCSSHALEKSLLT